MRWCTWSCHQSHTTYINQTHAASILHAYVAKQFHVIYCILKLFEESPENIEIQNTLLLIQVTLVSRINRNIDVNLIVLHDVSN